jgi:hypothetical protein
MEGGAVVHMGGPWVRGGSYQPQYAPSPVPNPTSRPSLTCCGKWQGNKVTETIFTGSREFIVLADSREIISQSPEPQSVSGAALNIYRVCPSPPIEYGYMKHYRASWRLTNLQS